MGNNNSSIAAADVSGDGKPDLVVASFSNDAVSVLFNQGDGTFAAPIDFVVDREPYAVTAVDLSGDGTSDIAVANFDSNTISVLLSTCLP